MSTSLGRYAIRTSPTLPAAPAPRASPSSTGRLLNILVTALLLAGGVMLYYIFE